MHHFAASLLLLLATAALPAQQMSVQFSPNPAPPGVPVTFTLTDSTGQGLALSSGCTWFRIHRDTQAGPVVALNVGCGQVIINVPPYGSQQFQWDQIDGNTQQPVGPGRYWIEARAWDAGFNRNYTNWFCLSVQGSNVPSLTAGGQAVRGQTTPLQVTVPGAIGGFHFTALSLDSNTPITVNGLDTCLSFPLTGDAFLNAFGVLDGAGRSAGLALVVPNLPAIRAWGLQMQALTFGVSSAGGSYVLTNPLSLTVQ